MQAGFKFVSNISAMNCVMLKKALLRELSEDDIDTL